MSCSSRIFCCGPSLVTEPLASDKTRVVDESIAAAVLPVIQQPQGFHAESSGLSFLETLNRIASKIEDESTVHYFKRAGEPHSAHITKDAIFLKIHHIENSLNIGSTKKSKFALMHALNSDHGVKVIRLICQNPEEFDIIYYEYKLLLELQGVPGIPKVYHLVKLRNKYDKPTLTLYEEFANHGCLYSYMTHEHGRLVPIPILHKLATDWINTFEALHSRNIAHRDIKDGNLLVHQEGSLIRGLVCDFEHAIKIDDEDYEVRGGTSDYASPEKASAMLLKNIPWSPSDEFKSDVWALGMTLMAVGFGRWINFHGAGRDAKLKKIANLRTVDQSVYMAEPDKKIDPFLHLLWSMCQINPANRLTMSQVQIALKELVLG